MGMGSWQKGVQLVTTNLHNKSPLAIEKQHCLHSNPDEISAVLLGSQFLKEMNVLIYILSYNVQTGPLLTHLNTIFVWGFSKHLSILR